MAFVRPDENGAALLQDLDVGLGGRIAEHAHIHRRSQHQRAVRGQHGYGQQVVAHAVRQFGHRVGRNRRDEHQIGGVAQSDVGDMPFAAPQIRVDIGLAPGDGLKSQRRDEFDSAFGQNHVDQRAALGQLGGQVGSFVSRDRTGDAQ